MSKKQQKYQSLYSLVVDSQQANHYYSQLPDYIKDQLCSHAEEITSLESMKAYSQSLLHQKSSFN